MHALAAGLSDGPARGTRSGYRDLAPELVAQGRRTGRPGALRFPVHRPHRRRRDGRTGNEIAAGADGGSRLLASQADREQVLDALKAAFVQGRLTKDEFDQRVGRVLATYAELDALIADIPAGPTESQLPELARESHNRKVIQRGTAVGAGASMAFTAALVMVAGKPRCSFDRRTRGGHRYSRVARRAAELLPGSLRRAPAGGLRRGRQPT